jgi:ATP-binding cassette subfamily F protein uup
MSIFTLQSVKKDFGIKEILKDANFSLNTTDKVGLIGTNGSGKSTLLKIIAGLEPVDSGQLLFNAGAKIIYLPQQPDLDENKTVLEQVFADSNEQMALVRQYEEISSKLAQGVESDRDRLLAHLSSLTHQIEVAGAWELETNAKIILTKLGIADFDAKIGDLSGGYRKRIALATALISEPDVLLMDEPTNHLDALSVEWLQNYLSRYRGALLLVTHDRYFLDRVTNQILEIDRGDLYIYVGNYAYYLEKKAEMEDSAASSQRKHAGVLRRELEWLKRGPKARSTKQKARIQRIQEMQGQDFKQAKSKVEISTPGRRIGKKIIDLINISKAYDDRTLIKNFTYSFNPEDRIGIIGSNGAGKSTLLNLITGRIEPDSGTVDSGSTIHIGYFDQHSEDLLNALNQNQRVIDYIKEEGEFVKTADGTQISASQMLERFLFPGSQQYLPVAQLSGGEKRRLFLLRVLMSAPNVLILDEPTNDLDVQTLAVLEEYLEDFNGCVIAVSHDRYFLDRTVDFIFAFEAGGELRQYPGNYSMYLEIQEKEQRDRGTEEQGSKGAEEQRSKGGEKQVFNTDASVENETPNLTPRTHNSTKPRKLSYKEKRELDMLESQIPEMETEKATLERRLYSNPPSDFTELQRLTERLAELSEKIDHSTERWLELSELA